MSLKAPRTLPFMLGERNLASCSWRQKQHILQFSQPRTLSGPSEYPRLPHCLPSPLKQYQGGGEQKVEEEEGSDSIHLCQAVITSGPVTGTCVTLLQTSPSTEKGTMPVTDSH
ncbi:hypothetical protein AOLI_G00182470 [Acnodon oligacanthus]